MPTSNILKGAAIALSALLATAPAGAAITTFATYTADTSAANLRWQKLGTDGGSLFTIDSASGTTPAPVAVKFNFLDAALSGFGPLEASYSLLGTVPVGNPASSTGNFLVQSALSGGFTFRYAGTSPLVVGGTSFTTGANLLTATFTNASIAGPVGSSSGNVSASTTAQGSDVTYTSDFLDFSNVINTGFAINLTSIRPGLSQANASASLSSFRTSSGGSFSSEPAPVTAVVPEPATWGMMVVGFGVAGFGLRRRRTQVKRVLA